MRAAHEAKSWPESTSAPWLWFRLLLCVQRGFVRSLHVLPSYTVDPKAAQPREALARVQFETLIVLCCSLVARGRLCMHPMCSSTEHHGAIESMVGLIRRGAAANCKD